ncbi:hypothetical protein BH11PSE3_BH11PSE3_24490 [soil metagenome]
MVLNTRFLFATLLVATFAGAASAQSVSALGDPPYQMPATMSIKPMTPDRIAWLKGRCSQLVAYFDRYGVSRGENSDGPRNHTRIGAAIECERSNYRGGIDTMGALLVRKSFDIPKAGAPAVEPEDLEAPGITNPTRPWYWL